MSADPSEQVLTARWVLPVSGPHLEKGTVTFSGQSIVAVEPHGQRTPDVDLGNTAIIPGLVNAHTHLDLGGARGKILPAEHFTEWLRGVIAFRRAQRPGLGAAAIAEGITESIRFGTTLIGDVCGQVDGFQAHLRVPLGQMLFFELIGLSLSKSRDSLIHGLVKTRYFRGDDIRTGLSPHSPYSYRMEWLAPLVAPFEMRLAIHLAESAGEIELLERHSGPFVPFLAELGAWDPSGLVASPEQVLRLFAGDMPVLFIHCNYLSPDAPVPTNASIVYCPRTHAAFGHPPHPFREFLNRGVRVALGTDSLASNPDLDLLAEARFIRERYPDFPGDKLLRMATLSGAEALGWDSETGSLEAGKSADLVVLPLPDREEADPHELIFAAADPPGTTRRSMWRGTWRD